MNGPNGYSPASYGAPPPHVYGAYGSPPSQYPQQPQYAQQPQAYWPYGQQVYPSQAYVNPMVTPKNSGLAVALELLGGTFFQTFGIGHLYAGNVGVGLGLMFGYWVLTAINFALCFVVVGLVTWPVTWAAFMVISAITASNAAKRFNVKTTGQPY
jgi:hypothetical protein